MTANLISFCEGVQMVEKNATSHTFRGLLSQKIRKARNFSFWSCLDYYEESQKIHVLETLFNFYS